MAENAPRPGDFFLAPISGIGGLGIRMGQFALGDGWLKIQHAGIYLGGGATIEAMPGGAIVGDISRFKPASLVWSSGLWDLSEDTRNLICGNAIACKGIPYSGLDYDALALHRFHIPTPHLQKYIADSGHMICSQLVDHVYNISGVHLFDDGRWEGFVAPSSLERLVEQERNYRLGQGI